MGCRTLFYCRGEFVGLHGRALLLTFGYAFVGGIGGLENGAQRNVKPDLHVSVHRDKYLLRNQFATLHVTRQ